MHCSSCTLYSALIHWTATWKASTIREGRTVQFNNDDDHEDQDDDVDDDDEDEDDDDAIDDDMYLW